MQGWHRRWPHLVWRGSLNTNLQEEQRNSDGTGSMKAAWKPAPVDSCCLLNILSAYVTLGVMNPVWPWNWDTWLILITMPNIEHKTRPLTKLAYSTSTISWSIWTTWISFCRTTATCLVVQASSTRVADAIIGVRGVDPYACYVKLLTHYIRMAFIPWDNWTKRLRQICI